MRRPQFVNLIVVATLVCLAACSSQSNKSVPEPVAPAAARNAAPAAISDQAVMQATADAKAAGELRRFEAQAMSARAPAIVAAAPPPAEDRERYAQLASNPLQRVSESPVSTLSVDVDTGAYSNVRRFLQQGSLPPRDAVRVEEMINYFDYAYAAPRDRQTPFSVVTEIAPTPWNAGTRLLQIGIQGWKPDAKRLASNLVFLVDVSGSMNETDKLPLVKASLKLLAQDLRADDRISLVVYAGQSGVVLEPTPGDQTGRILDALERLQAGGSTNGAAGIEQAYRLARQAYIDGGVNRVLLATDGDFNVGVTSFDRLLDLVREQRRSGIALTTLGFGEGNYNEQLMEQLADVGNGNYAYIDSMAEAQKVLVRQRQGTLQTIAADVKVQIEFNPAVVAEYRLIGYENRVLAREDFSNDHIDAGEIGAGHTVTALYEIALVGGNGTRVEPLRYGAETPVAAKAGELAHLRLRYKKPQDGVDAASQLIERPIQRSDIKTSLAGTSRAFRWSAAVAAFGQLLRGGVYTGSFDYTQVLELARGARGDDAYGNAGEFLQLVQLANSLSAQQVGALPSEERGG